MMITCPKVEWLSKKLGQYPNAMLAAGLCLTVNYKAVLGVSPPSLEAMNVLPRHNRLVGQSLIAILETRLLPQVLGDRLFDHQNIGQARVHAT